MTPLALFCFLLTSVTSEDLSTPSSLIDPDDFNAQRYEGSQYLEDQGQEKPDPTKQGPVLFPSSTSPPPKTPLIVTARPLAESILKSDLYSESQSPEPQNVSTAGAETSLLNRFYKPNYLTQVKSYRPYDYPSHIYDPDLTRHNHYAPVITRDNHYAPVITRDNHYAPVLTRDNHYAPVLTRDNHYDPVLVTGKPLHSDYFTDKDYGFDNGYNYNDYKHYDGVLKKMKDLNRDRFGDYEEETVLPPIYKAFADVAKQKLSKIKHAKLTHNHAKPTGYSNNYETNHVDDDYSDDNHDSNYAFAYAVRDKKTGDDFSHKQQSSGSATKGEYRVRLPDGRMQIVSYIADENGYHADVRYDDEDRTSHKRVDHHSYVPTHEHNHVTGHDYNAKHVSTHDQDHIYHPKQAYSVQYFGNKIKNDKSDGNGRSNDEYKVTETDYDGTDYRNDYKVKEDYIDAETNDYHDDYSTEYENKQYEPHRNKFSHLAESKIQPQKSIGVIVVPNDNGIISTVQPSIESLRDLFLNKIPAASNYKIPVQINVPSTTPAAPNYDNSAENVVHIGGKQNLYTNIRSSIAPVTESSIGQSTPSSYLSSTIAALKKNVDLSGSKPVLSDSFLKRINKYLTF